MPDSYAMQRRYSLPFDETFVEGDATISYGAILDRCAIQSPMGNVRIGDCNLTQCVVVEPCRVGDNTRGIAAILQGDIGERCLIEAHADIRGTLQDAVTVRTGASIQRGALIGEGAEVQDGAVVREGAEVGANAIVGPHATIGRNAYVSDDARIPAYVVIDDGGWWDPTDARHTAAAPHGVGFHLIEDDEEADPEDDDGEEIEDDEEVDDDDDGDHDVSERWLTYGGGRMVRGSPYPILDDFAPGTARSWVLVKLARLAAFVSTTGRIDKKLIRDNRPDLLEHPVVKEVLRIHPAPDAETLNRMSWDALGEASYDVWFGRKFHSGHDQMLGPRANDVFVLSVPERVLVEVCDEIDPDLSNRGRGALEEYLFGNQLRWHPDQGVPRPLGWVRVVLYPHTTAIVVEIQSDRPWMQFRWAPDKIIDVFERARAEQQVAAKLREMYLPTFAADALNIVVEWALSERYHEVLVLDYESRMILGGTPPRDFYDKYPKQYSISKPAPLPKYVDLYHSGVKARRIVPNTG